MLKQSIPYRAILAARGAQIALSHGFIAIRDLETEGAMYADVDLKKAIANGEVPTGMYPLLGYPWELKMPTGVQYVDGVHGARKRVREQVMYGADWVKYYSDRREHFGPDGRLHSSVNFADEESRAIVEEAHRLGKKVAADRFGWLAPAKFTRVQGADIVMESITTRILRPTPGGRIVGSR